MSAGIKRREFITLLGGAVASWPLAASAQASTRRPRIIFLGGSQPRPTAYFADGIVEDIITG